MHNCTYHTIELDVSSARVNGRYTGAEFNEQSIIVLRISLLHEILLNHVPRAACGSNTDIERGRDPP
jgi:hypothetical protein